MATAKTLQGRLLCASICAYGINDAGQYIPTLPYNQAAGWEASHPPVAVFGGDGNINACLVGKTPDGIVVAFRGTFPPALTIPSITDWWQGIIDCPPTMADRIPGRVHSGFRNAVNDTWEGVVANVQQFRQWFPNCPLYIAGHSKGGAMAGIAAAHIAFNDNRLPHPEAVYTFGAPHAGDTRFVNGFPASIPVMRYENALDIVSFLSPEDGFIKLVARIPYVGPLFERALGWDYDVLGDLRFIEEDLTITESYFGLPYIRIGELIWNMAQGETGFVKITNAHRWGCGSSYFSAICPDVDC